MTNREPDQTNSYLKVLEVPKKNLLILFFGSGPKKGKLFQLNQSENTIGRHDKNTIVLKDQSVSGKHAKICSAKSNEWQVEDLSSGTLINGSPVKVFVLSNGDKISIGDYLLQFIIEQQ